MGIDALIMCKGIPPQEPEYIGLLGRMVPITPDDYLADIQPEATHRLDTGCRHYGIGYERGPWPKLAAVLMELMSTPTVEKVWYGGDEWANVMTPEGLQVLNEHFIKHGHRPHRESFKRHNAQ